LHIGSWTTKTKFHSGKRSHPFSWGNTLQIFLCVLLKLCKVCKSAIRSLLF
jgi:hypothetical protein